MTTNKCYNILEKKLQMIYSNNNIILNKSKIQMCRTHFGKNSGWYNLL